MRRLWHVCSACPLHLLACPVQWYQHHYPRSQYVMYPQPKYTLPTTFSLYNAIINNEQYSEKDASNQ